MGLQPKPVEIDIMGTPGKPQPQPASPSYDVGGRPVSPLTDGADAPSLRQEMEANWEISVFDQTIYRIGERLMNEPEEGFNPWDHLDGYELYADSLVTAQSRGEIQQMKARIDSNQRTRETLARGEWGWIASLLSGVGDPVNLIPVPGAMGMGFLKGAIRASAGNVALAGATAPLAMAVDPTTNWEEQIYSIGGAALFGAAFGGVAGMIGKKSARAREARAQAYPAMGRFVSAINEDEGMNISRGFNAREEEYNVSYGNTRSTSPAGTYEPVAIRDFEEIERSRVAADGVAYHYDDAHGWVPEADRGSPSPRAVPDEIRDELGIPARIAKREMLVDDVALRAEFEVGRWRELLGEGAIRSADEFVTYKQLEAVARREEPKLASETPEVFARRIADTAFQEIKDGRVSSAVMPRTGLEPWLDKLNFSPVAKGGRMFPNDNVLTDVLLQIGGDYGWAIRANKFGYKTPPSVLVRSMKHGGAFVEIKQALDGEWLKFVQQNQQARGKTFMSLNITASAESMKRGASAMMGNKVITKAIFNRMAGRAAFDPEPFKIDGFDVVPEAREAAKAWTRIAQRYDAKARELGIFYDQTSLKRTQSQAEARVLRLKAKAAEWLWGGQASPSALRPAVKVGDRIFEGDTHDEALRAAMDELGPDIEVNPTQFGYVPKPRAAGSNASKQVADQRVAETQTFLDQSKTATRFVARANKPYQEIGNTYEILPINEETFQLYLKRDQDAEDLVLRSSRRQRGEPEDTLAKYQSNFPEGEAPTHIYVGSVDGGPVELSGVGTEKSIREYMMDRVAKTWFRPIDSFDAPEATAWRNLADEERYNAKPKQAPKPLGAAQQVADKNLERWGWTEQTGGVEPERPKFTVQKKMIGHDGNALGFGSFDDYVGSSSEFSLNPKITDPASFRAAQIAEIRGTVDRSLWEVATALVNDGMRLRWQETEYGFNGISYFDPTGGKMQFRSAQAHAFLQKFPPEWIQTVQQTLDTIFPHRADPLHSTTLTSELTNPEPGADPGYNQTAEQARADYLAGARTAGLHSPVLADDATGMFQILSHIRVAVDRGDVGDVLDTAWHETVHALRATGRFTNQEWDMLRQTAAVRGWHTAFTTDKDGKVYYNLDDEEAIAHAIGNWAKNPDDPRVGRLTPYEKTLFERFAALFDAVLNFISGMPKEKQITLGSILDEIGSGRMGRREPQRFASADEALAFRDGRAQASRTGPTFRTIDETIAGRVDSLSERQREVYDRMKADIDEVQARGDNAKARLDEMAAEPHKFLNQFGQPEPFFARFWHKPKIMEDRAKMEALLTAWYRRDQPINAEARAAKTVDDMLNADPGSEEDVGVPGLRHLHKRTLDIPNSFRINDPVLGEIAVGDFIETDLEIVSESYTRTMGTKIETAEMFGDTEMFEKMQDIKEHFMERYMMPAALRGESIAGLAQKREEYLGWVGLTRDAVLGGLRDKEAYNVSNRIAKGAKNLQVLNSMGRVLIAAGTDAMRLPMVNGFGTAFKSIWVRLFADMKTTRANTEFSKLGGTLLEMAIDRRHAELASIGHADPGGGGTWIERKLEKALPSFFKLVGLSQWTVMMKDISMFATQHRIMDLAMKVDEGNNQTVLAAMGISRRDAKMMAKLPMADNQGLILPTVDQWTGPDGRKARRLLLDALVGEVNRTIITPSIADKSLLFAGVAARKGKKVAESDWFSVPLQFMSFGVAANQKLLMSAMQGRDHSVVAGAAAMLVAGVMLNYLRTPSSAMMNKSFDELLLEGYETSGLGGLWFGDLNGQIERFTRHSVGVRPLLGMDPKFGKSTDVGDYVDILGPAPSTWFDVANAFVPGEKSMTNRAQTIRRAIPYNNVIWWGSVSRDLATGVGKALE